MIRILLPALLALASVTASAQFHNIPTSEFLAHIDRNLPQLLEDFAVPGCAIAIIDDGELILQRGYGLANVATGEEVGIHTGFNIGSVSKTFCAWGILTLVQEGKLDLDAPALDYVTRWELPRTAYNPDDITLRRLLSHTAGLSLHGYPGWTDADTLPTIEESLNGTNNGPGRVEVIHQPGTRYKYSGGGYTIMQLIIEEVTGMSFADYIDQAVLEPNGLLGSSFNIDADIRAASAAEYGRYGQELDFQVFTAQAAAGFHTTIDDLTRFAYANLYDLEDNEPGLPKAVLQEMMTNVPQAEGKFGYGLGYMSDGISEDIAMVGHRGANQGWHATMQFDPVRNDAFIMLTNAGAGFDVYNSLYCDWVEWQHGLIPNEWGYPNPPMGPLLVAELDRVGIEGLVPAYEALKAKHGDTHNFDPGQLNELGYYYLSQEQLDRSVAVFKLNTERYPDDANAFDSLGEALLAAGELEAGLESYKQSVRLYPANTNALEVLKAHGVDTEGIAHQVSDAHLKRISGVYVNTENAEWIFHITVRDGQLIGLDNAFEFAMVPRTDNHFIVVDHMVDIVFDPDAPDGAMLSFGEGNVFKQIGK